MTKQYLISFKFSLLFGLIFIVNILNAQSFSVDDIKPIKTSRSNSYVSNQDNILSENAYNILNQKLDSLEKSTTAQVAVVALQTSGGISARDLSEELFNKWNVGQKKSNNGLIVMLIVDSREVFIRTGYGLEGALTDAKCTRIVNEIMAPYFKKGDWDNGMIAGIDEINSLIVKEYTTEGFAKKEPLTFADIIPYILIYLFLTLLLLVFAIININKAHNIFNISHKEEKIKAFSNAAKPWYFVGILFPIMLLIIFIWHNIFKARVRYKTVICKKCNNKMHRLNEKDDDKYLSEKQIMEEHVKSKDYDVWLCDNCGNTDIFAYDNSLTQYSVCPNCGGKTMYMASDTIVSLASVSHDGKGRKTYICKNCGHSHFHDYTISNGATGAVIGASMLGGRGSGGGGFSGGSFGGGFSGGGGGGGSF